MDHIKSGGWVKLCWNDFLGISNKKIRKHMGVVKLCWNKFLSKANDKNVIKSGGGSNYVGMIFIVNLQKSEKTYGSCQIMLE